MDNKTKILATIKNAIKECDIHIVRISEALTVVEKYFPLTEDRYDDLENCCFTPYLDQFVYRYAKLQDKIGGSIIKNIVYFIEYSEDDKTFIDKLNVLEREGLIESTTVWEDFRDLRNRLSHEYAFDIEQQINTLNEVYKAYFVIKVDFSKMKAFLLGLL